MIDFLINEPEQTVNANLMLAHGAGALMDSAFMNTVAESVAKKGVRVWRFEFPYMRERRETGKKRPPNTQKVLLDSWREAFLQAKQQLNERQASEGGEDQSPIFIGGKSMGGRMASLIADELQPNGLICLGYPFHALGKPDKPRTEHLAEIKTPTLIVQGTRDPMGSQERVAGYDLSSNIRIVWLDDGDHDFKPRVKSGLTHPQNMAHASDSIVDFVLA